VNHIHLYRSAFTSVVAAAILAASPSGTVDVEPTAFLKHRFGQSAT